MVRLRCCVCQYVDAMLLMTLLTHDYMFLDFLTVKQSLKWGLHLILLYLIIFNFLKKFWKWFLIYIKIFLLVCSVFIIISDFLHELRSQWNNKCGAAIFWGKFSLRRKLASFGPSIKVFERFSKAAHFIWIRYCTW